MIDSDSSKTQQSLTIESVLKLSNQVYVKKRKGGGEGKRGKEKGKRKK